MSETPTPFTIRAARLTALGIKGLRVKPEHFARREANRKAVFAGGLWDESTEPEGEDGISLVTGSLQKDNVSEGRHAAKKHRRNLLLDDAEPQQFEKLYQDEEDIRNECLYTKYTGIRKYSLTDSRESRNNYVWRELIILRRKGRIPTFEVRVNFFCQFPTKWDIDYLRTKLRNCLKYRKIAAIMAIGLTRGKDGKPNNTVHLHILMGDKENDENLSSEDEKRRRKEIAGHLRKVCERQGLVWKRDFKIESQPLGDGETYFIYFVKHGKFGKDIPLFIEGLNMQEFTHTGWFEKGEAGENGRLWDEYCREKYGEKYSRKARKGRGTNYDSDGSFQEQ